MNIIIADPVKYRYDKSENIYFRYWIVQPMFDNLELLSIIVGYVYDTLIEDIIPNDKDIIQGNIIIYSTVQYHSLHFMLL